jgi:hypothetical protein
VPGDQIYAQVMSLVNESLAIEIQASKEWLLIATLAARSE